MEELLELFRENFISLQITLDWNSDPIIHALVRGETLNDMHTSNGETIIEALEKLKVKLIDYA